MMTYTDTDRTLAFAGILQALQLVQAIAYGRPYDVESLQRSLQSILKTDADTVNEIYAGPDGVRAGLRLIQSQLMRGNSKPDVELSRYLVTLLHLERKLSKRSDLLDTLSAGIERATSQTEHYEITHSNVLANLADNYAQTVSTLSPKIMVNGDPGRLRDSVVANQIRALLLAAMRSAVLWRQCGGSRLGLLLSRGKLVESAGNLLKDSYNIH